jgi:pimeloyl-ACP methyl ester carboxylesterase
VRHELRSSWVHDIGGRDTLVGRAVLSMNEIEVDGLRIAFERRGEGPPLVLLHGGVSDHREWRRQLDGLSDEFMVVAWDAPGCGSSSDPPDTFRMPDYAHCLAAFVGALGLERPHILGLSWGSTLALELYRRSPRIPRTLVLAAAYAGWAGSLPPEEVDRRLDRFMAQIDEPPERWARDYIPGLLTHHAPLGMVEELVTIMAESRPMGMRAMLLAMAEADLRDALPRIAVPTLLLQGEEDERSPRSVAQELHAQIRGSTLVVIPEAGHQSNMEAADRFNLEVRNFLRLH